MREDSPEPSRSPWSTPTESEIYEAQKSALSKEKDAAFKELGLKVKTPIPNKKNTKKQSSMADGKTSPKKKTKKGNPKQKDSEEKDKTTDADNNETKVTDDTGNENKITDITIPDVIPPPADNGVENEGEITTDLVGADEKEDVSKMENLTLGEENAPNEASSPRGSKAGLQSDSESSPKKGGRKNSKLLDKKNPVKKKGVSKNENKKDRSNSPEKTVTKGKNKKESLGVEQNSAGSQDRTGSSNSKGSGDSLKLGADYTTINGELNNESNGSAGANNIENGEVITSEQGKTTIERPTNSPKKRKGKLNSSLRRESVLDKKASQNARSTSSSPKKAQKEKIKPIENDPNKWSAEVKAMEKWKTLATSNGQMDTEKVADLINSENSSNVNSKDDEAGNKKKPKRRESKALPKSPSKESPTKSPTKSPPKSPAKSPRKKLKDVLSLPPPYDEITSGKLRHWETVASRGEKIDDEKYPEYEHVRQDFFHLNFIVHEFTLIFLHESLIE